MADPIKIVLIDDDKFFCNLIKVKLEKAGNFQVHHSQSGPEGIRLARSQRPDLILLDILMPGTDGSEVAADIIDNPATAGIPILFLTAMVNKEEVDSCQGVIGGREFIAKPVDIEELATRIRCLIA